MKRFLLMTMLLLEVPAATCSSLNHRLCNDTGLAVISESHLLVGDENRNQTTYPGDVQYRSVILEPSVSERASFPLQNWQNHAPLRTAPDESVISASSAILTPADVSVLLTERSASFKNLKILRDMSKSSTSSSSSFVKEESALGNDDSLRRLLVSIFTSYMQPCVLVIAYEVAFEGSPVLEALLKLPNPRQLVRMSSVVDYGMFIWKSPKCRGYVFLQENPEILQSFSERQDYEWDFSGRYIVVGLTKVQLENMSSTEKFSKSENFIGVVKFRRPGEWGLYTNKIVVERGVSYYTTWKVNRFTPRKQTLFPDKLSNFRGAPLTVTAFDWRPSVMYKWDDQGHVIQRYGRDIMVVRGLAYALNATLVFNDAPQEILWGFRSPNGSWNGLMGIIQRGEAEVGVANLYITNVTLRMLVADFSVPFDNEVICFLSRLPKPLPKWERILYPFEFTTWLSVLAGLVMSGPVLYVLAKIGKASGGERTDLQSLNFAIMYALGIQFMEGQAHTPIRRGTQVFVSFLWLYATIITTVYSSNLTALLTVARQPSVIDTIRQLHESGMEVGGMGAIFGTALASSTNPYLQALSLRYDVYNGRINVLYSRMRKGDIVIIAGLNVLRYMETIEFTHGGAPEAYVIKETFSPYSIGLITQRGSPLKGKFDVFINRMVESGLVNYWFLESLRMAKQELHEKKKHQLENEEGGENADTNDDTAPPDGELVEVDDAGVQSLSFEHLEGFFFILLMGYVFSGLAFIFEMRAKSH
ncbi:ionotropic receptor 21a-like [Macrobrachium rosenbergii]|uniref:ionotropic receptor 21a-like n=1 Tax=Macrobrachium rosenbergii TaxID=79674 RepID=UPI0034D54E66